LGALEPRDAAERLLGVIVLERELVNRLRFRDDRPSGLRWIVQMGPQELLLKGALESLGVCQLA
jgi:hypothetical protein